MKRTYLRLLLPGAGMAAVWCGAVMTCGADYATEVLAQQPLAYWRFNENVSTAEYDTATNLGSLGPAGNGRYYDTVVRSVEGAIAGDAAVGFSNPTLGTSYFGAMGVPNDATLNPDGPFTVEFWAKPSNNTAALLSPVNSMSFTTGRLGYLFYQNAASWQFRVGVGSSTTASLINGGVVVSNQWQHVVGVFNPTTLPAGTMTLYVDGVQVATGVGNYEPNTNASFFVGSTASPNRTFDGAVDEVAFYDVALSASKIAAHFTARTANPAGYAAQILGDDPVGYWRLNEPAKAFPVAANAGTLGAAVDGDYCGAVNTEGPSGSSYPGLEPNNRAAAFDGTASSYVQADSFGIAGPMTMLAWVKPNILSGDRAIAGENASYAFKLADSELRFTTPGILDHTSSGAGVQAEAWQFAAVTFAPGVAGGASFYLNGALIGTLDASALNKGTTAFWIGKNQWAGQSFNGAIDEVAVYDKILNAGRIMSLFLTATGTETAPYMVSDPPVLSPTGTIYTTTSFTITPDVAGSLPMTYQWRRNGQNLPGATSYVYSKSAAAASDAGTYDVVIGNAHGSVTSQGVTVVINPAVPPAIDQQPAARFVYPGGTARFTVAASGTQPMTYQWRHAGTDIDGATNATLVVTNCTAAQAGAYTVSIANVAGTRLSSSATLTLLAPVAGTYEEAVVNAGPVAYWRLGETAGTTAFDYAGGHDARVLDYTTLNTAGPSAPSFPGLEAGNKAYAFDGASAGVEGGSLGLPGPLSVAAWVNPNALSGDRAIAGENASWAFKLLDNELRFTTPGVLDHNSSGAALAVGEWQHVAATFEPGAADGARFYVNGRFVSSATASTLNKGNSFFWIGTNQWTGQVFDGVIDEVAVFNKILPPDAIAALYAQAAYGTTTPPSITAEPVSQVAVVGAPVSLTVGAAGSLPLSYQWKKDGAPIAGATASTYTIPSVAFADAGSYSVSVTNPVGGANSATATLAVLSEPTFANLTNDLVLHLRFDGNYTDSSGRQNDVFVAGAPGFVAGKVGQGVHIATTPGVDYLQVLDYGSDLTFDETVSFTVSFWLKYTLGFNDVPIIGNAVNSTWQIGWVFTDSATTGKIEWSLASTANTGTYLRDPVPGCPTINDGAWHQVVGVVDRDQQQTLVYVDGVLAGSWSIAGLGSLASGYYTTIGQDPNGSYGSATFDLDDLGIWRRALSSYDVMSIYNAAHDAGQSFDVYGPVQLTIAPLGADWVIAWQAGTLESNTDLKNPSGWKAVQGANAPLFKVTPAPGSMFYRVRL